MKKTILKYIATPVICAIIGSLLLLLVSFIPQSLIQKNASASADQLAADESVIPRYMNIWDWSYASDLHTDTLIMMGGYNLNEPSAVLLNPYRGVQEKEGYICDSFIELVDGGAPNDTNYVRYWQGFRIFIRPMLLLFPYFQLRQVVSWVFFGLLFFMLAALAERKGAFTALAVGLAVILVNPAIISHSLQYTPCFNLAFAAMIFLLYTENLNYDRALAFCVFGILTQFFDFYTAPIAVCGLPLLVWLLIDESGCCRFKTILKCSVSWLYGYASFWVVKLVMVSIFTDVDGLGDGIGAFLGRVGTAKNNVGEAAGKGLYTPINAFIAAWDMVTPGATGAIALIAVMAIVAVSALIIWKKKGFKGLVADCAFLAVAALPVLWFSVASQPTVIHAYFQYRPLVVFFAGVFLFALQAFPFADRQYLRR
ncbi:MAG: hypothetical protein IJW74_05465 [Oscillospiraceae bacterium]|nr:hypothetical protein [Oscillospiraceae bacterium]